MARLAAASLPAVLALGLVTAVVYAVHAIGFDWELYVGEQQNAYFANTLANDGRLYFDWNEEALLFPNFPPGFYVAVAPLSAIAGSDLWAGRLMSLLLCALGALAAGLTARKLGANRSESLVSAIAFLSLPVSTILMFNARPDALAIALTGGALLAATSWEETRGRRALWLAAAACVAILFTRPNYAPIALAIAVGIVLRDRNAALRFTAYTAGGAIGLLVLVTVLTDGEFIRNMRDFSSIGSSWANLLGVVDVVTLPFPNPILAIAAVEVAIALRGWRAAPSAVWAWPASILILLTAVRTGSADNYVFALAFTSSILLGPALARVRRSVSEGAAGAVAFAIALLLLPSAIQAVRQLPSRVDHLGELDAANRAAVRQLEAAHGSLLGDRLDLSLAAGGGLQIDGFIHPQFATSGVWDQEPLAERIRAQEFALIQTSADPRASVVWTPGLTEAMRAAYCPVFSEVVVFPGQSIWVSRPCDRSGRQDP
jgi:dolichyl-phosphate-mannose-protein mannosyltransferase